VSSKRFKFGLERVRELRVDAEDRAKQDLASSLADRIRQQAEVRAADDRLLSSLQLGRDDVALQLSGTMLQARQAWTERLERSRVDAQRALDGADAVVAQRRTAVAEAGRAREALDRLRDKRLAEHKAAAARAEDAVIDEIALRTYMQGRVA
jgi:flagellar protein FliJ